MTLPFFTPREKAMLEIDKAAADHFATREEVLGPSRTRHVARARQAAYYALHIKFRWSLPKVGSFMDRHHASVHHGIRQHCMRNGLPAPVKERPSGAIST